MSRCGLLQACLLATTLFAASFPSLVSGASIDDRLQFDPVRVQVIGRGVNSSFFVDVGRDYLAEYREGVYSFFKQSPGLALGTRVAAINMPKQYFTRDTTDQQTVWTFQLVYNETQPGFHPYEYYTQLAMYCNRREDGMCEQIDGGLMRIYVQAYPRSRQWLLYFDSVLLECCDGTWQPDRQSCPDCAAVNYLPVILGCTLGFVGAAAAVVGIRMACRVQKRRRANRGGVVDAGHKPPPKHVGPAFDVHKHSGTPPATTATHEQPPPMMMMMMRADHMHMGHHTPPPPPVVVKIDGHKPTRKDEPDQVSTPEDAGHGKHEKHDKHAQHDDKKPRRHHSNGKH
jgi:hypothetical protein